MAEETARALADLILAAGNIVAGVGSPRGANGTAVITSDDRGRSVTALVPANWIPGPAIAIFEEGNQRWVGISGAAQGLVEDRLILSERHRPMDVGGCRPLEVAFVYRITNADQSQQIWLSDFGGTAHLLRTVPKALSYGSRDYTIQVTYPAFTWKRYDIVTNYTRNVGAGSTTYENVRGTLEDMSDPDAPNNGNGADSGSQAAGTSTLTRQYACDHPSGAAPPATTTGTAVVDIADRIIPKFAEGEISGSAPGPGPLRPSTSIFENPENPNEFPAQRSWGDLADTGGSYPATFDGNGEVISVLTPYYFDSEDNNYWGVTLSGLTLQNPDGIGSSGSGGIRAMTGVSSSRYRNFSGVPSATVNPGQSRPQPIDTIAQTEILLSYSSGKLQVLVRDTGRPSGVGPGVNCQAGEPGDDWFVTISKHELVGGAIQDAETANLPGWIRLFDSPLTSNQIRNDLQLSNITEEVYFEIIGNKLFSANFQSIDFFVSESSFIPVESGIETVYGWEVETSLNNAQIKTAAIDSSKIGATYFVYPIQVDLNSSSGGFRVSRGGGSPEGDALPLKGRTQPTKIFARLITPLELEDVNPANFDVISSVASWTEDNFKYCLDASQIVSISIGGS